MVLAIYQTCVYLRVIYNYITQHILKNLVLVSTLIFFCHCTNDKKINAVSIERTENKNDTIVIKKNQPVEPDNSEHVHIIKEIEYCVSLKSKESNIKYSFTERNDGKVVISKTFDFLNSPPQKNVFEFNELKFVMQKAKNDFKISSLEYLIYGTLDSTKNISSVKKITEKYIKSKNGKTNISTKDYGEISKLILQSEIVTEINKVLFDYSKTVSKINIEKAHFYKSNTNSNELINCFVVMEIENK